MFQKLRHSDKCNQIKSERPDQSQRELTAALSRGGGMKVYDSYFAFKNYLTRYMLVIKISISLLILTKILWKSQVFTIF